MVQSLDALQETPSQTAGPFVHIGLLPAHAGMENYYDHDIGLSPIKEGAKGDVIEISGSVYDGTGWALRDALIESWQPDAAGKFSTQKGADPCVHGYCRFAVDGDTGEFTLRTVKPGRVGSRYGVMQAPHISLWIVARGLNLGLQTRIYFDDEENAGDPLLSRIEQAPRVQTLIAKKTGEGKYRFDIRLQGEGETVFLDI